MDFLEKDLVLKPEDCQPSKGLKRKLREMANAIDRVNLLEFQKFPKIPRFSRDIIITEKIDGTNATIYIPSDDDGDVLDAIVAAGYPFYVGSRSRWITPDKDNYGFAKWAYVNAEELLKFGPGWHRGEWWGQGINRAYGLKEKRFSLFNVSKWSDPTVRPACCHVVPVLYCGPFHNDAVEAAITLLRNMGSYAAPGYMNPEGVVIFHTASGHLYKKTLENDEKPKGVEDA